MKRIAKLYHFTGEILLDMLSDHERQSNLLTSLDKDDFGGGEVTYESIKVSFYINHDLLFSNVFILIFFFHFLEMLLCLYSCSIRDFTTFSNLLQQHKVSCGSSFRENN